MLLVCHNYSVGRNMVQSKLADIFWQVAAYLLEYFPRMVSTVTQNANQTDKSRPMAKILCQGSMTPRQIQILLKRNNLHRDMPYF